jgi:predicted DCC family thiol-disulfide oxidoreductase YuxK
MNFLLYDGECPFCSRISRYYKIKQALAPLEIVSMRDTENLKRLQIPQTLDFNQGMLLILQSGQILQGEEAFRLIHSKIEKSSLKDRVMFGLGSKKWISSLIYPILLQVRKIVLKWKGIPENLERVDLSSNSKDS